MRVFAGVRVLPDIGGTGEDVKAFQSVSAQRLREGSGPLFRSQGRGLSTMPWFKIDDKIHSHPKMRRAGLPAMGLWALAGSHCMDYLTDGVVEAWFVESWPNGKKLAAELIKVGLWDKHQDGWAFHDWAEYQPTREKVLKERAEALERMHRVRANKPRTFGVRSATPSPSPSPDLTKTSKSQSLDTHANDSTDSEISAMTSRLAGQSGLTLPRIVEHVREQVGRDIEPDAAYRLGVYLLGKAKTHPNDPQKYVLGAITKSSFEVQQYIDQEGLT